MRYLIRTTFSWVSMMFAAGLGFVAFLVARRSVFMGVLVGAAHHPLPQPLGSGGILSEYAGHQFLVDHRLHDRGRPRDRHGRRRYDRRPDIEALRDHRARALLDARLLLAGRDGNQTPLLLATATRLGLDGRVAFLGPRDDVADLLCAADVVAIPSRWEGLSNVLIEAMAMEAPVVASDLPILEDAVGDDDLVRLVRPGDAEQLAAAISATLDDPAGAAERAGRAHRRFMERFTIDNVVDQMAGFYRRALAGSGRR